MIWCLHGAVGSHRDWDDFALFAAAAGQTVRAVDLWRYLECEGLSLLDWAKAFNAEVRASGSGPHQLIGYSMGGRLALHALLDDPTLWQSAHIISAHPGLRSDSERLERIASDAQWAALALTADWSSFLAQWNDQSVLAQQGKWPDRTPLVNRRRAIARSFMEWSLGKQADLSTPLTQLPLPLHWLTGGKDDKFTQLAQNLVPHLPTATHHLLPDCAHRIPWENPTEFARIALSPAV